MSRKWISVWIIVTETVILLLLIAFPAYAQEATPENDENCVACHEHQYYLYDRGKWFCLCDAPMHCVYCHGGRTDTPLKDVAHEGLVLYPTREHAARCQTCHTEDYMARVVSFTTAAGVSNTPQAVITATALDPVTAAVEQRPAPPFMRLSQFEPWQLDTLVVLAIALVGIAAFGYRCWKADCLARNLIRRNS